ncbi:MAG: beta-N-acetylhexosaminidase [bacterium]
MKHHSFSLSSHFTRADGDGYTFELRLKNASTGPLSGFTLGVSGPGRIALGAALTGGTIIDQMGTWCEIAPSKGFVLQPGEVWTVVADHLDYPLKHWTDGTASASLRMADGTFRAIPVERATSSFQTKPNCADIMDIAVGGDDAETLSIIPWPAKVQLEGHRTAPDGFTLQATSAAAASAAQAFSDLVFHLFPGEGLVRPAQEGGFPVALTLRPGFANEAYALCFQSNAATVEASTETGLLYGMITLVQLARGARKDMSTFTFPQSGQIDDAPAYEWRGCHWDVARRFYASGEVAQFLRIMAWNKLNRFHWHLSEDEAWRIEIDAYPELTEKAAWRGHGMALPPFLGSGPERSGGYYSKDAVRSLITLGQSLGIEIVPEIDLPGHCHAMLIAMPQLRDPQENGLYHSIQKFPNNCLNPALPQVQGVLETILTELCDLFPSRYFHLGADEVPSDAWASSPRAQARLLQLGGTGMAALQADFLNRLQAFLTAHGKITGAWEEAAHGGGIDRTQCYLVGWQTVKASRLLASDGYEVVVAPAQAYYLDMANGPGWGEPGAAWAGCSSPEATYTFDPAEGWTAAERLKLKGVQACIWGEPMTDRGAFQRLVFPRLSAIAETAWTLPEHKNWPRFANRAHLMPSLYPQSAANVGKRVMR